MQGKEEKKSRAVEVKTNFSFEFNPKEDTLTIFQNGKEIVLSYWDCIILYNILEKKNV